MREARVAEVLEEVAELVGLGTFGSRGLGTSGTQAPVAAFDGDGTLWSGDVGEDFFHAFVREGDFRALATTALVHVARAHGLEVADPTDGAPVARQLFEAYEAGTFHDASICELIAWAPAGRNWAEYRAFFETRFPPAMIKSRLHEETVALVEGVRRLGVEVFLVSASPKPVVESAAAAAGIPADHVLAATPRVDASGMVQPSVNRPIPYGAGKVARLSERIGERPLVLACGDNAFDEQLLRHARIGCAVRPKPRLAAIADRIEGLRLLRP
ncbi:hypothetical protein BH09MYX1_BH09MYX1_06550 [soil metagenome]